MAVFQERFGFGRRDAHSEKFLDAAGNGPADGAGDECHQGRELVVVIVLIDQIEGQHDPRLDVAFHGLVRKEEVDAGLVTGGDRPRCEVDLEQQIGARGKFESCPGGEESGRGARYPAGISQTLRGGYAEAAEGGEAGRGILGVELAGLARGIQRDQGMVNDLGVPWAKLHGDQFLVLGESRGQDEDTILIAIVALDGVGIRHRQREIGFAEDGSLREIGQGRRQFGVALGSSRRGPNRRAAGLDPR